MTRKKALAMVPALMLGAMPISANLSRNASSTVGRSHKKSVITEHTVDQTEGIAQQYHQTPFNAFSSSMEDNDSLQPQNKGSNSSVEGTIAFLEK